MTRTRNRSRKAFAPALDALEGRKLLSTTTDTLPSGSVIVETFDPAGHLTGYTQTNSAGDMEWSQSNGYNAAGKLISRETDFGNFGPLPGSSLVETFSATTGRETSSTRTFADGSMQTATFSASTGNQTSARAFDAAGNITSDQVYIYSPGGNLQSIATTNGDGSTLFQSFYADGHEATYVFTDPSGNVRSESYADVTSGTWQDMMA
jgi:hypothetical protein